MSIQELKWPLPLGFSISSFSLLKSVSGAHANIFLCHGLQSLIQMMRRLPTIILGLLFVCLGEGFGLVPAIPAQVGRNLPFPGGESLHYSISLWGIPAGQATMTVKPVVWVNEQPWLRLVTTAQSNDFVSFFFPVNNLVDSHVNADTMLPDHLVFHRREGKRKENFDVTFDHQAGTAKIVKDGQVQTIEIPPSTHDPLSCLYYLRKMSQLDPGNSVRFTIHHDKRNYDVEVQVETVESVAGPWGNLEATRVLILMPFRGIFLNEGNIRVWLTQNRDRVPLKMQARVMVGSVEAVLESPL